MTTSSHDTVIRESARQNWCAAFFWKPVDNNALVATRGARESIVRTETMLSTRPRVLLADDYPEILNAVSRLLAPECEIVGTVADGSALLETAQRLQPDVIVLDVNLPNVRSLEACREITRMNPEIKVIMFTAMGDPNTSEAFLKAGASAFMSKMASVDLLSTIKRLCVHQS